MVRLGLLFVWAVLYFADAPPTARAEFAVTGNVAPVDPASWTSSTIADIGQSASGSLTVDSGNLLSRYAYIGHNAGVTGVMTVTGANSTWTNSEPFFPVYIGHSGKGTLNITAGGVVTDSAVYLGYEPGSTGAVTVDGVGSKWINNSMLTVGGDGSATLTITNGGIVSNTSGNVGNSSWSKGVVTVEGIGSTWNNAGDLNIGGSGNGTLKIAGGTVSATGTTYVTSFRDSIGLVQFGNGGGTLTTGSLAASPSQLMGAGTIHARGLVSDVKLVFDSAASLTQTLRFNSLRDQDVTVNLDMASNPSGNGALGAGWKGAGSLTIRNGTTVKSESGYIGQLPGSTGEVTVTGSGSTWSNAGYLYVGNYGNGTLNITGGGAVNDSDSKYARIAYIGSSSGSTGLVNVDGYGSTWASRMDLKVGYGGSGTLHIANGGAVSNNAGYIGYWSMTTGSATVSGSGSTWTNSSSLDVGYDGSGALNITNGGVVSNTSGRIGCERYGSTGVVKVDGPGSKWINSLDLAVGFEGKGVLKVVNGGAVSNRKGRVWSVDGSAIATIDGAGSTWSNRESLSVGDADFEYSGALKIADGARVTSPYVAITKQSLLTVDVGNGSQLSVGGGNGTLANDGNVRILAGAGAVDHAIYTPISAGRWSGNGTCQALGGTWDSETHRFTASDVVIGTSGKESLINLAGTQRVLIGLPASTWSVGASFQEKAGYPPAPLLSFTATAMGSSPLTELELAAGNDQTVLGAWQFAASGGYVEGDLAYLSFGIPGGYEADDLRAWHYDGANWTEYFANDLTCSGGYASFTVTGFSGYALTAMPVPEPGAIVLLVISGLGLLAYAWRRRRQVSRRNANPT